MSADPVDAPSALRLGPLIRHVGANDATIWVETTRPGCVEVRAGSVSASERPSRLVAHSYAVVVVDGLAPGSNTPYEVRFDDELVWPVPSSTYPPSLIRTIDPARPLRLIFGSCRSPADVRVNDPTGSGEDVLGAYARGSCTGPGRVAGCPPDARRPGLRRRDITARRGRSSRTPRLTRAASDQVADFEEYTRLYRGVLDRPGHALAAVRDPELDDLRRPRRARRLEHVALLAQGDAGRPPWWRERIIGALTSLLDLPAPGQPVAGGTGRERAVRAGPRRRPTASRCSGTSPSARTARPTAAPGSCGRSGATSAGSACSSSTRAADAS